MTDFAVRQIKRNISFRLIVDDQKDGRMNMAVDEALLEQAGNEDAAPVIRLYGFKPATLSVGRFQRTEGIIDFSTLRAVGADFVRRPSGGHAVLHDCELTYSIALGRHILGTLSKRQVYRFIVPILIKGLARLGVLDANHAEGTGSNGNDPDCFASSGEFEIGSRAGSKLIGSAQIVSRSGVLQHGSIPLSGANRKIYQFLVGNRAENQSTSVSEEIDRTVDFSEAISEFAGAIRNAVDTRDDTVSSGEKFRASKLLATRYNRDEWNLKY